MWFEINCNVSIEINDKTLHRKDLRMRKRSKTTETAQQAYDTEMTDIHTLIGWLQCELENTPEKIQWPHVGSLQKIKGDLLEALAFKSGHHINDLKEALEDARL